MAVMVWVMVGLAAWHFTVFVPDRFWGGIVGAFLASAVGAVLVGLLLNGFSVPSQDDTNLITALQGLPGGLLGLAGCYAEGVRRKTPAVHL